MVLAHKRRGGEKACGWNSEEPTWEHLGRLYFAVEYVNANLKIESNPNEDEED